MAEKYLMISIDDERAKNLADVLGNKTSKRIISYLIEKEATEAEIVKDLDIPANTINYNIKKLVDSGLIEKAGFFWSVKGKKMPSYKVSKKMIVISPKISNVGKVFGAFLLTGAAAFFIRLYTMQNAVKEEVGESLVKSVSSDMASGTASSSVAASAQIPQLWLWFLLGGLTALLIYMILNWRKL